MRAGRASVSMRGALDAPVGPVGAENNVPFLGTGRASTVASPGMMPTPEPRDAIPPAMRPTNPKANEPTGLTSTTTTTQSRGHDNPLPPLQPLRMPGGPMIEPLRMPGVDSGNGAAAAASGSPVPKATPTYV